jgi:type VI secretion system protein ImpC
MADQTQAAGGAEAQTIDAPSLLDQVIQATRPQNDKEADRAKDYFKQFLEGVVKPGQVVSKDVETNIKFWIGEIDKKLSTQLNEIMPTPTSRSWKAPGGGCTI